MLGDIKTLLLDYENSCIRGTVKQQNALNLITYFDQLIEKAARVDELEKENEQLKQDAILGKALTYATHQGLKVLFINGIYCINRYIGLETNHLVPWYKQQLESEGE